ncbi:MAG TPA: zinc-finger domain-containing protein [Rickettsiales bacterium]|nr:zinc-finger domain-containing protein [Rickettsiales bacterium]
MANTIEILHVNSKKISCDGVKEGYYATSGHPLIYLNMGKNDFVICPYCSKYFTVKKTSVKKI